jgi:Sec-independent protein translocase protein TatA
MRNLGTPELVIILLIVFLLFGGVIVRRLGKGVSETTKEIKKLKKELKNPSEDSDEIIE